MAPDTSRPTAESHSPLTDSLDVTGTAKTVILDIAAKARNKALTAGHAAADIVDRNRDTASRVMANAASTLHEGETRVRAGRGVTRLAEAAAGEIDAAAQYVQEHDTQQILADLKQFVRRHPGASVVGAAVVGALVGRGFRRH